MAWAPFWSMRGMSEPHTPHTATLTSAWPARTCGLGLSSRRMSPGLCITAARMVAGWLEFMECAFDGKSRLPACPARRKKDRPALLEDRGPVLGKQTGALEIAHVGLGHGLGAGVHESTHFLAGLDLSRGLH